MSLFALQFAMFYWIVDPSWTNHAASTPDKSCNCPNKLINLRGFRGKCRKFHHSQTCADQQQSIGLEPHVHTFVHYDPNPPQWPLTRPRQGHNTLAQWHRVKCQETPRGSPCPSEVGEESPRGVREPTNHFVQLTRRQTLNFVCQKHDRNILLDIRSNTW